MDQQVTFTGDIPPLFKERNVSAMSPRFDLSFYEDVRERGADLRAARRGHHVVLRSMAAGRRPALSSIE